MKITTPESIIWGQCPTDIERAILWIERAGRICYRSEDSIVAGSGEIFVQNITNRNHWAVLEHSNFVCRTNKVIYPTDTLASLRNEYPSKYLDMCIHKDQVYIGGNYRAWLEVLDIPDIRSLFMHFITKDKFTIVYDKKDIPRDLKRVTCSFKTGRDVTHELVRHRPVSYCQESQRYCAYRDELEFIEPLHYRQNNGFLDEQEEKNRAQWIIAMQLIEDTYHYLLSDTDVATGSKKKKERAEQARSVLPNCTATTIAVTTTLPEWEVILNLRTSSAAYLPFAEILQPLVSVFSEKYWI